MSRYETKSAMLKRLGRRSNNWLKARIAKDGFPLPVFLGGRDALFEVQAVMAWEDRMKHEERRIVTTPPRDLATARRIAVETALTKR